MSSPLDLFERFEQSARASSWIGEWESPPLRGEEILARIRRCAARLAAEGVARGARVLLGEMPELSRVVGLLAVWSLDAVALPAEAGISRAEAGNLCRELAPRCMLTDVAGCWRAQRVDSDAGAAQPPPGTALIKLTSGSTGRVKGIAVGAAHLLADGQQIVEGMGIRQDDVNLGVIPLAHSYGLGNLMMPLVLQGTPLLLLGEAHPTILARALSRPEPCVFPGVPALYDLLLQLPEAGVAPGGLRLCLSAGAPLRPTTARAFRQRTGLPIRAFYGASECGGISYDASPSGAMAESEGCVGTPLPRVEVRLEGGERRVQIRSAAVAFGYHPSGRTAGEGEFIDGWFKTGDIGRFDEAGGLHLSGRIGALINVAGRKVNPREVEAALLSMPEIGDAAVLGVPDAARGEALVACLVSRERLSRETVLSRLRAELAEHKLPRRLIFLPEIPRNARGKIDRRALLDASRSSDPTDTGS